MITVDWASPSCSRCCDWSETVIFKSSQRASNQQFEHASRHASIHHASLYDLLRSRLGRNNSKYQTHRGHDGLRREVHRRRKIKERSSQESCNWRPSQVFQLETRGQELNLSILTITTLQSRSLDDNQLPTFRYTTTPVVVKARSFLPSSFLPINWYFSDLNEFRFSLSATLRFAFFSVFVYIFEEKIFTENLKKCRTPAERVYHSILRISSCLTRSSVVKRSLKCFGLSAELRWKYLFFQVQFVKILFSRF